MKMLAIAALAAAAAAATGCATAPQASTEEARAPREYVTGSNIGRRPGEAPTDQIRIYSREALETQYRTGNIGNGATPGPGGS